MFGSKTELWRSGVDKGWSDSAEAIVWSDIFRTFFFFSDFLIHQSVSLYELDKVKIDYL